MYQVIGVDNKASCSCGGDVLPSIVLGIASFKGQSCDSRLVLQGCAVVVEANQLESGQKAHIRVSSARSGCFLQPEVMEVGTIVCRSSAGA